MLKINVISSERVSQENHYGVKENKTIPDLSLDDCLQSLLRVAGKQIFVVVITPSVRRKLLSLSCQRSFFPQMTRRGRPWEQTVHRSLLKERKKRTRNSLQSARDLPPTLRNCTRLSPKVCHGRRVGHPVSLEKGQLHMRCMGVNQTCTCSGGRSPSILLRRSLYHVMFLHNAGNPGGYDVPVRRHL